MTHNIPAFAVFLSCLLLLGINTLRHHCVYLHCSSSSLTAQIQMWHQFCITHRCLLERLSPGKSPSGLNRVLLRTTLSHRDINISLIFACLDVPCRFVELVSAKCARVRICADHFHKPANYTKAVRDGADLVGFDSLMAHCSTTVAPHVVHNQALSALCKPCQGTALPLHSNGCTCHTHWAHVTLSTLHLTTETYGSVDMLKSCSTQIS